MRSTVLVSDLLVYIPALIFFLRTWHENRSRQTRVSIFIPSSRARMLMDNAEFRFLNVIIATLTPSRGFRTLPVQFSHAWYVSVKLLVH